MVDLELNKNGTVTSTSSSVIRILVRGSVVHVIKYLPFEWLCHWEVGRDKDKFLVRSLTHL